MISDNIESNTDYFGNSLVTDQVTTPEAYVVNDAVTDEAMILSDMNLRLERIEKTVESKFLVVNEKLEALISGVNTIGGMMNQVAEAFDNIMQTVNKGGIGALLGGFMGGKKNG